jgi:protein-disulfide isomerase
LVAVLSGRPTVASTEQPDVVPGWIDRTSLGNPEAAVTVQAWEDFLCPACGQWNSAIKPRLFEDYVSQGTVLLEFHQFPLQIHAPGAAMGAMASECAADQGAFWPYHERLFAEAANRGQAGFQLQNLVNYAGDLNLDEEVFQECMVSQTHRDAVNESVNQAVAMGLNSTPSVLVNGRPVDPFDYGALQAEIDRLLAAAETGE